jgi:hypothetical protein
MENPDVMPVYTPEALREHADHIEKMFGGPLEPRVAMMVWAHRAAANALEATLLGIDHHPETATWSDTDKAISANRVVENLHTEMRDRLKSA